MTYVDCCRRTCLRRCVLSRCAALSVVMLWMWAPGAPLAEAWDQSHANAANTGFVDVVTLPANLARRKVSGIGPIAPGAGPVIGPDGSVYMATRDGVLSAFTPAGDLKWRRTAPGGLSFWSSPAAGLRDTLYMIAGRTVRDNRTRATIYRAESQLLRYTSSGTLLSASAFPTDPANQFGADTHAAPILWNVGTAQIVIVPAVYPKRNGYELRLLAFTDLGGVMFDQLVTQVSFGDVTGSGGSWFGPDSLLCQLNPVGCGDDLEEGSPEKIYSSPPMPSAGLFGDQTPIVVVADNYQSLVGYSFSATGGFSEVFRKHLANDGQLEMSTPALLRDGHSVISARSGDRGWLMFGGPGSPDWAEVFTPSAIAPTLLADGRILVVSRDGSVRTVRTYPDRRVIQTAATGAQTIVPAAASCTHVFVSTVTALITLDATSLAPAGRFDWREGGLSPPVIAPNGTVYAAAGGDLDIFTAPRPRASDATGRRSCVSITNR